MVRPDPTPRVLVTSCAVARRCVEVDVKRTVRNKQRALWLKHRGTALERELEALADLEAREGTTRADQVRREAAERELAEITEELGTAPSAVTTDVRDRMRRVGAGPANDAGMTYALPSIGSRTEGPARGTIAAGLASLFGDTEPMADPDLDPEARAEVDRVLSAVASGQLMAEGLTTRQDGALAVPGPMSRRWLETALEDESHIARLCRFEPFPVEGNSWTFPAWDDVDETSDAEAGVTAAWTEERGTLSPQKPKLRAFTAHLKKLGVLVRVSSEMQSDAVSSFASQLSMKLTRALGKRLDKAIIDGSGAGMPEGVLNSDATITVSKEGSQAANTILLENITKMYSRLLPSAAERATWLIHTSTLPQMLQLSLAIGTAGAIPAWGFVPDGRGGYTLLGRPVVVTSRLSQLGTVGDIIVGDFSQYLLTTKGSVALARSEHLYFDSDEIAVRGIVRADGGVTLKGPVTPQSGSDTLSAFVTLETRS